MGTWLFFQEGSSEHDFSLLSLNPQEVEVLIHSLIEGSSDRDLQFPKNATLSFGLFGYTIDLRHFMNCWNCFLERLRVNHNLEIVKAYGVFHTEEVMAKRHDQMESIPDNFFVKWSIESKTYSIIDYDRLMLAFPKPIDLTIAEGKSES